MRHRLGWTVAVVALAGLALVSCTQQAEEEAASEPATITITEATYGQRCSENIPGVPSGVQITAGNVTNFIAGACNGRPACDYPIDARTIGDPAPRCPKDLSVTYTCSGDATPREAKIAPEASRKTLSIGC